MSRTGATTGNMFLGIEIGGTKLQLGVGAGDIVLAGAYGQVAR